MFGKRKNRDTKDQWQETAAGSQAGREGASAQAARPSRPDASAVLNRQPTPPVRPDQLQRSASPPQTAAQTQATPAGQAAAQSPAPSPAAAQEPEAESETGNKLIVGRDISLAGEIRSCEKLVVEGTVDADLSDSQALEIAGSGIFQGSAVIDIAEIAGRFEGDLTVRDCLKLRATGYVKGTIRYRELEIESGGRIGGTLIEIGSEDGDPMEATVSEAEPAKPAVGKDGAAGAKGKAKAAESKPSNSETTPAGGEQDAAASRSDGGLFGDSESATASADPAAHGGGETTPER